MKKGEIAILAGIGVLVAGSVMVSALRNDTIKEGDRDLPFYTTADTELRQAGAQLIKELDCRRCHSIWTVRNPMQSVPAPPLDGLGSLYDEEWFFTYLSAEDPQSIVPSRLKAQYRMPSYAFVSEGDRRTLSAYLGSLKVEDWYLEETKKREYEKLTGKDYPGDGAAAAQ